MKEIIVQLGQSMADLAIQHYGNIAGVFDLADRNNISPTAAVAPGTVLLVGEPIKKNLVAFFVKEKITVATNKDLTEVVPEGEGIGFWAIEDTFIIQ